MSTEPAQTQTSKEVKNLFKPITELQLEELAGVGSYGRGLKYFRDKFIYNAVLRGDTLHAQCYGSQEDSYRLSATLVRPAESDNAPAGAAKPFALAAGVEIKAFDCDCEAGGFCKHLVALLLTWLNKPETIELREEFTVRLQSLSHEQLVKLCVKLLERQPDMEYLIDLAPPAVAPVSELPTGTDEGDAARSMQSIVISPLANTQTVDVKAIRRRLDKLFEQASYDYDDYYGRASELVEDLEPLISTGDEYAQAGQWANAKAVYETIALEASARYEELEDEDQLGYAIDECCDGLAQCLDAQAVLPESARFSLELRRQLIQSLFKLWENDVSAGGMNQAKSAKDAIARNVTLGERAEVEAWLQSGRKQDANFGDSFNDRQRALFHVALKVHSGISDEAKLEEYRKFGLYAEVTELLLQMGRVDEAMEVALKETPASSQLTTFADKMLALGGENVDRALNFIARQQEKADAETEVNSNVSLLRWLSERYANHNQPGKALEAQTRLFHAAPGLQQYRKVKEAAELPGNSADAWTKLRPDLISTLETRKAWRDLTEIYIEEKQARQALDTLALYEETMTAWRGDDLHARVASVSEMDFPDEARIMYQLLAENLIELRGRDNYRLAASYLARAKDLAGSANRLVEWNRYIAGLRDKNNRLTALKEELKARNLL